MPGGISWTQQAKRDKFVEEAAKAIQRVARTQGYGVVCKETLAMVFQRYKQKYNPPALPVKSKKKTLSVVEE